MQIEAVVSEIRALGDLTKQFKGGNDDAMQEKYFSFIIDLLFSFIIYLLC
jgi:hypothetical protein